MKHGLHSEDRVANSFGGWVIEYGNLIVDCRDEEDAKRIVRGLRHRARVIARTGYGSIPGRRLEGADLAMWLFRISPAQEPQQERIPAGI
jgi:hypothetical protein